MKLRGQVFRRSVRMGIGYVVISLLVGTVGVTGFGLAANAKDLAASSTGVNTSLLLSSFAVPFGALVGLVITIPVYILFVYDKNGGVLEYLLAVGMSQMDIFRGYMTAALQMSLIAMLPALALNFLISKQSLSWTATLTGLSFATGLADVAFVTILMTSFSSMQRRPSGMNSPLGISIGTFFLVPELPLAAALGAAAIWFDVAICITLILISSVLLLSVNRLIVREKLLP